MRELGARKPQYRVVGNVTQLGDVLSGPSSGTFKLVQVATGQVLWEETISLSDSGSNAFIDLIAKSITRAICDVPVAFTGTGQADIIAPLTGQTFSWSGKLGFALDDGGPKPDGTFHFNYKLSFAAVDNGRATTPAMTGCTEITRPWSGTPATQTGDLTLIVHTDNSRSYDFSMGLTTPAFDQTGTCDGKAVTFTTPMGVGLTSGAKEPWLGPTLAGAYSGLWPGPTSCRSLESRCPP